MSEDRHTRGSASVSLRVYKVLLSLYPRSYRQRHGEELIQNFEDMERDANSCMTLWRDIAPDFVKSLGLLYLSKPPSDIVLFAIATCLPFLAMLVLAFLHSAFDWYPPYVGMTQLLFDHPWAAVAAIFVLPAFGMLAILIGVFTDLRTKHGRLRRHAANLVLAGLCAAIVLFLPLHYRAACTVNGVPYQGMEQTLALLQSCGLSDLNNNCGPQITANSSLVVMCCRVAGVTDLCLKKEVAELPSL